MPPSSHSARTAPPAEEHWRAFAVVGALAAIGLFAALFGAVLALDPYGRRAGPDQAPSPIMDINQRYMYPQLARSGLFDSAVFGTSTARLLDPRALDAALGGRFANLAINAGTPWEQVELARLFLRHVPEPKTLVFGLDRTWCDPGADTPAQRVTFRSFPPWLYDEEQLNDLPHLVNLKTLEITGRVALYRLGGMPARIRGDGYEVFTPPEASYDLARARQYLYAAIPSDEAPGGADGKLPAIGWLAGIARDLPAQTRLVVLFPPVFVAGQPAMGSAAALADERCKREIAAALTPRATLILDYRLRSPLALDETNFWDPLHYRLPIAARIAEDIWAGLAEPREAQDGRYRLLSAPAR